MSDTPLVKDFTCMDDYDPNSLPVNAALETITDSLSVIDGVERLHIRQTLNRILAEDIISSINVPASINSAMDGYAFCHQDISADDNTSLQVIGTSWAGIPFAGELGSGQCVRIMTGGILPDGSDTVVIQESVERKGEEINFEFDSPSGSNVRQAGEDIKKGQIVLNKGIRLTAADIGLLASLGMGEISVKKITCCVFLPEMN